MLIIQNISIKIIAHMTEKHKWQQSSADRRIPQCNGADIRTDALYW